jgi:iron complex outermembrane receptor protein
VPNVSSLRKGGISLDPVVRGFKFSQLNVILDNGIKIENGCPNRMDPVTAHVEAEDIEKIEVIKGPFVLKYGPSFGGVINLITEEPHPYNKFEIHASAIYGFETNWNGQKEHISLYGGNKKIYFLLSGNYKDYGNYKSGNLEGHDTTFSSSFKKYNYSGKLGFAIKHNQSIMLSYTGISGRDVMYPCLPMDEKSDDTRIVSADYKAKDLINSIKLLDIKIYQSNVDHVMDNSKRAGYLTKQMIADVNAINTGGRAEITLQQKKNKILAGLDMENISKDGTRIMTMQMMGTTSTKKSNLWYNALVQNAGIFAEYSTIFSSFEVNASIRGDFNKAISDDTLKIIKNGIDYFNDVNSQYLNFSASAGITKKINEYFNISLAFGRGTRSPNMTERFIKLMAVGYDNYDYLGNPQLKPETNNEIDLTLKYSKDNIGGIYLNGFYSHVQNYITANLLPASVITPQTQGVFGVKQFVNTKYVTFMGCEFGYTSPDKYKFGGSVVAAYTYAVISSVTKYIVTGTPPQVTGNTIIKNDALSEIPPFESTLNIYYKFLKGNLIPKITFRAVADQRHTSEAFYEPYTPGFGLLNFAIKYKINNYVEINAGVNNIFDRAYYEHLNRKIIGTTGKLYEPGRVFFVNLYVNI